MGMFKKAILAAALASPVAIALALPAQAQVAGVAVIDPDLALNNSRAWKAAATQLQTTFKPDLDRADARAKAIQAELQPLVTQFETARRAPTPNEAALRTQAENLQKRREAAQQEIGQMTINYQRARAYAIEQLQLQLRTAIDAAANRKNASIVLLPSDVAFLKPAADLTADVTTELDRIIPTVSITPPPNWQPGQQAAAGQQPAARPAATPPQQQPGR